MARLLATTGLVALLAACGTDTDQPAGTTDAATTTEDTTMTPVPTTPDDSDQTSSGPTEGTVPPAVLERQDVRAAVSDLAGRLDVSEDEVTVKSYADVTWSDGSLGCPEPGRMYTMALVDGGQLILEADGEEYAYHNAHDKPFFYCADPVPPTKSGSVM